MKKYIVFACFSMMLAASAAQDRTGVWRGSLTVAPEGITQLFYIPPARIDPTSGRATLSPPVYMGSRSNPERSIDTRAKLEIVEINSKLLVQLTSYGSDNRQVILYAFIASPTNKQTQDFFFAPQTALVNETNRVAELFNMRGSFQQKDSAHQLKGYFTSRFGGNRLGSFQFQQTNEPLTMNPELLNDYLTKNKLENIPAFTEKALPPSPINDTLVTNSYSANGTLVDNGFVDGDTLSIWLNGRILEDNVIPTKTPFHFRVPLETGQWNNLTIRCKSEGKQPGTGILVNLLTKEASFKYNIVLYQYHQANFALLKR